MRIGIDYRSAMTPTTGVGVYTYALVEQLIRLDSSSEYLLFTDRPFASPFPDARNVHVHEVVAANRFVWEQVTMPRVANALGVTILHRPSDAGGVAVPLKMPYVISVHDLIPLLMRNIYLRRPYHRAYYYLKLAQTHMQAQAIITVSEKSKYDLVRQLLINPDRIVVTYHGVRVMDWIASREINPGPPPGNLESRGYILGLGGSEYRKNNLALLAAYERLVAHTGLPHRLVVVGGRWRGSSALHEAVAASSLGDRVVLLDHVTTPDLYRLYAHAALFVFPSRYEGFGIPALEAMAFETAVITSTSGALPEIVGDAALLVDPDDIGGIAAQMSRVLHEETLRTELIARGRRNLERFSYRRMAEQTLALYTSLAGR